MIKEARQSVIKPKEPKVIAKLREVEKLIHEAKKD